MSVIENIANAIKIQIQSLLPVSLERECEKAATTIKGFVFNDKMEVKNPIISPDTLKKAKGLVILTIGKAGISFTIRGGSGILIARLPDGTWSAPSAVKTGGFGVGSQIGAEIIELVMVLTTEEAVKNFRDLENITLGGNVSAAIGEVGRAAEASSTVKNASAIISYGKSKGVYFGMSVEGAVIQQNNEANAAAYGKEQTVEQILSGDTPKPDFAQELYSVLKICEDAVPTKSKSKTIASSSSSKKDDDSKDGKKDKTKEANDDSSEVLFDEKTIVQESPIEEEPKEDKKTQ